jgi:hypothetical protein
LLDGVRFDGANCEGALFDEERGPRGGGATEFGEQEMTAWDELAIEFLREMLTEVHTASGASRDPDAELFKRWSQTVDALLTGSDQPPEAWKPWIEPLMKMLTGEQPLDLKAVVDALSQEPADLRSMLTGQGALAVQLLNRLRSTAEKFDVVSDQLPEEWRLWLERLSKTASDKRTIDRHALHDLYGAFPVK